MTEPARSQIGAHAAIAAAVIVGAQFVLVDPARGRAAEAQAQTQHLQQTIAQAQAQPPAAGTSAARTERLRTEREAVARANALADPAVLVAAIQDLGAAAGVRVDRIDPEKTHPRDEMRKGDPGASNAPTHAVELTIDANGTYASIARFVRDLEARPGFVRTEKIDVRPSMRPGDDTVSVTIQTSQLAFDPAAFEVAADPSEGEATGAGS